MMKDQVELVQLVLEYGAELTITNSQLQGIS